MGSSVHRGSSSKRHSLLFYGLLALPACFAPLSIDLLVPSLPSLADDLAAGLSDTQLSIYAFVLAYGLAPFFWGSLSDRYGRKPLLLLGILLYAVMSLACTVAPSITTLVVLRFFQGFAAAAGIVVARAMLRDRYGAEGTTRAISTLYMFLAIIPIVLPIVGGYLSLFLAWTDLFLTMFVIAIVSLLGAAWRVPETLSKTVGSEADGQAPANATLGSREILANKQFLRSTFINMFAMSGTVLFVGNYSFLSSQLYHATAQENGYILACFNFSLACGIYLVRGFVPAFGVSSTIRIGVGVLAAAWFGVAGYSAVGVPSAMLVMALIMLASFGHGIIMALSPGEALVPFSVGAGKASAIYGCIQSVGAALISYTVALLGLQQLSEVSKAVALCALCMALCFFFIKSSPESASDRD
ncbi:MAG: Bcr/CflA family efflux MFS transporter [Pseudomonadales bacterium]